MGELVIKSFASALPPVRQNSQARFELQIDGISDAAVGPGASDAKKVASLFWSFERRGQAESDVAHLAADQLFGGGGNVPGEFEFFRQNVCSAGWQESHGNAMAVERTGQAV